MFNTNPTRLTSIKVLKSEKIFGRFEKVEQELNCHVKENIGDDGGWYTVIIGYPNVKARFNFIPELKPTSHFINDMEIPHSELKRVCAY